MTPNPHCLLVLAVAVALTAGGVLSMLALDGLVWALLGNDCTVSHAMWLLGRARAWMRCGLLLAGFGGTVGMYHHFWGWVKPW